LDIDYRNQRISKAQYDAELMKKKADAFDAEREEKRLYNNARTAAANARANQINTNRGGVYDVPSTIIQPAQQQPIITQQPVIPPRSGVGTTQQSSDYYVPSLPQAAAAPRQTAAPNNNPSAILESAITKRASGQPLTSDESAVLGIIDLLDQGVR